ncbi:MAG: hypothetical protein IJ747_04205 [Lachnospiraceae bacterium]|nr:hypothetical protein [Lachnospiraceae bacterium]
MHNRRRYGLRRALAGVLSAAMIFSSESSVLLAAPLSQTPDTDVTAVSTTVSDGDLAISADDMTVSIGDAVITAEDVTVSDSDATPAEEATVSDSDAAPAEETTVSDSDVTPAEETTGTSFTLSPADVQYGEDGSNQTGNLDALFAPRFVAKDTVLTLGADYTVTYKFFTENAPADAAAFAASEGAVLAEIPAGTQVTVAALAVAEGSTQFATADFTVSKRKVVVRYTVAEDTVLDGRDVPEDGKYVLAADTAATLSVTAVDGTGFAADLSVLTATDVIDGDVTLDVSDVDVTEDGYQVVGADFALAPSFDDNYEIVGNIFGDVYVKKAQYYITLTANNNGEQWTKTYPLDYNSEKALNEYSFYNDLMKDCQSFINKQEGEKLAVVGWTVYTDGFNISPSEANYHGFNSYTTTELNADGYTYEYGSSTYTFKLSGKKDYHFVAQVTKAAAENIYVTTVPSVFYDGRAHMAIGSKVNTKKQAADLRLQVYNGWSTNSNSERLTLGKDYVISNYKNNVNASMKLVGLNEDGSGSYVKTWTSNDQRPSLTITGIGQYKGFSADVYFDILPQNLGAYEYYYSSINPTNSSSYDSDYWNPYARTNSYAAAMTAFADGYVLKSGKLTAKIKPAKVTKSYYSWGYDRDGNYTSKATTFSYTLKEGTDYTAELYLWNETGKCWEKQDFSDPNKITQEGDYLYLIRGTGNYCGAIYDDSTYRSNSNSKNYNYFSDGKTEGVAANPARYVGSAHQFTVREDGEFNFSKAKVSISKKSLPFKEESGSVVTYGASDFGITVKNSKGQTLELGKDYTVSFSGRYGHYNSKSGITNGSTVGAANDYTVTISPMGEYYGASKNAGTVKITGLKLKANFFELSAKKVPVGEDATWSVSAAGAKLGLTTENSSSSYYVRTSTSYSYKGSRSTASKVTIYVAGGSSPYNSKYGYGIDPTSVVKLSYSHTAMTLQQAYADGVISFEFPDAAYNVKGAMPENITIKTGKDGYNTYNMWNVYSGRSVGVSMYTAKNNYIGYETLTFTFKNNTKVGQKATVTIKGTGALKGSITIKDAFTVKTRTVNDIDTYSAYDNGLYLMFTDGQMGKGSLDKPSFKLYQAYETTKGTKLALVKPAEYKWEVVKEPENERACGIKFTNIDSENKAFDFGTNGITCYYYALYDNAKLPAVTDIKFYDNETTYKVSKNHIDGYAPVFTGNTIWLDIESITLADGTTLYAGADFDYYQSGSFTAGSNTGSVTLTTHYNSDTKTYPYKGKVTLKFDISSSSKITL